MTIDPKRRGASIRIYLADGTADGVWVVEKSNWTGKALMAPRARYKELRARPDLAGPGVYVLIGPSESGALPTRIYIGETDDLRGRLDNHQQRKDFWSRAVVFTSKDDNLNKAHIRYLEARLIALAAAADRSELENGNAGSAPQLSEPDTAEAESFLDEMLLIYPVLGVSSFQQASEQPAPEGRLYLAGPHTSAEGAETADGFVVYADGHCRIETTRSMHGYVTEIRARLVSEGIFERADGDRYRIVRDYVFPSPSQAATVLLGRNANGRIEWKNAEGTTLRELQAAEAPEAGAER